MMSVVLEAALQFRESALGECHTLKNEIRFDGIAVVQAPTRIVVLLNHPARIADAWASGKNRGHGQ